MIHNAEPTAEEIEMLAEELEYAAKKMRRIAKKAYDERDPSCAIEVINCIRNLYDNIRTDLLITRPLRELGIS